MNLVDKCVFLTKRPHFNRYPCVRHYIVEVCFQTTTSPAPNSKNLQFSPCACPGKLNLSPPGKGKAFFSLEQHILHLS